MKVYCDECGQRLHASKLRTHLAWEHNTVRVTEALNKILNNLDRIPIEELEKLGDKYAIR